MDTQGIVAFITAAETGSFTLTAEKLFLTQPAVSRRIAVMEASLGAKLFDRIGKTIKITSTGEKVLPIARQILAQFDDMQMTVDNLNQQISGKLTVATSHHIGLHRLPGILRRYSECYPQVNLDIRFMDSEQACQLLLHGQLDLAIVTLPQDSPKTLSKEVLWLDPLHIVTNDTHPLSQQEQLAFETVLHYPAVLPSANTYTRRILDDFTQKEHRSLNIAMETNYLETLAMLTSVGMGWSLLPEILTNKQKLKTLNIKGFNLHRELGIVTHTARTLSNAATAMCQLCRQEASS